MAFLVACKILIRSISSASIRPIEKAVAVALISISSFSRIRAESFLESFNPSGILFRSRITAAATTGPAKAPRPTSSIPAMNFAPDC